MGHVIHDSESRPRAAGEDLRRSEERFRLLVDSVVDYAIFLLDPDGTIATWNQGARRLKGYTADEVIGRHFSVFYAQSDLATEKPWRELALASENGSVEDEGWRVRKDGTLFWANVVITALRDEKGTLLGFAKVTRDLTERRAAEEALRQSEERFRLLVSDVKDHAIFALDPTGHVESWNVGAQALTGYAPDEILGRHLSTFYLPEDIAAGKPARELDGATADGRYEDEGWRLRKDGSRFWASVIVTALRGVDGNLIGFSKLTRDLTERRAREQQLERTLGQLRESNAELDDYASFVSHDLQEPLRKMASFAELLARRYTAVIGPDGQEYVSFIVDGAVRMRRLITDALDYARVGRSRPASIEVDLDALIDEARADLEPAIEEARATIHVSALPRVVGDRMLLARVIVNLLSNAIKYRDRARPLVIQISADQVGDECVLSFVDNGIGFDPSKSTEILRPFGRLHTKEDYPGTGLGLAATRRIVESHGGRLWAEGSPGVGARFFVALPTRSPA